MAGDVVKSLVGTSVVSKWVNGPTLIVFLTRIQRFVEEKVQDDLGRSDLPSHLLIMYSTILSVDLSLAIFFPCHSYDHITFLFHPLSF